MSAHFSLKPAMLPALMPVRLSPSTPFFFSSVVCFQPILILRLVLKVLNEVDEGDQIGIQPAYPASITVVPTNFIIN
eukprot:16101815-Heterocapsa_arctica.AAC.1